MGRSRLGTIIHNGDVLLDGHMFDNAVAIQQLDNQSAAILRTSINDKPCVLIIVVIVVSGRNIDGFLVIIALGIKSYIEIRPRFAADAHLV